jgi:hypothetical protein
MTQTMEAITAYGTFQFANYERKIFKGPTVTTEGRKEIHEVNPLNVYRTII